MASQQVILLKTSFVQHKPKTTKSKNSIDEDSDPLDSNIKDIDIPYDDNESKRASMGDLLNLLKSPVIPE